MSAEEDATGFQPVNPWDSESLRLRRRNLPHLEVPDATYLVTFRCRDGAVLPERARDITFSAMRHWDGERIDLDAAVVMPDHAHAIFRITDGSTLSVILHSIKSFSSNEANRIIHRSGTLWLDESFDHIIRHEVEWEEKREYIRQNPVRQGLVRDPEEYRWLYLKPHRQDACATSESPGAHGQDARVTGEGSRAHRLEACAIEYSPAEGPHRQDACATEEGSDAHRQAAFATEGGSDAHREDACATEGGSDAHLQDAFATPGGSRWHRHLACDFRDDPQHRLWSRAFAGVDYYYGHEPGPVARRALRYHQPRMREDVTALDAGCGEGQDVAFLAERGYRVTGIDFTETGIQKARQLLRSRGLEAELIHADLRKLDADERLRDRHFDVVLAVNALQFMGVDGSACLDRLRDQVKPGGVIGLSLWAREEGRASLENGIWFTTLEEVMARFRGWRMLEAANLWQWNPGSDVPLAFVTLVATAPG